MGREQAIDRVMSWLTKMTDSGIEWHGPAWACYRTAVSGYCEQFGITAIELLEKDIDTVLRAFVGPDVERELDTKAEVDRRQSIMSSKKKLPPVTTAAVYCIGRVTTAGMTPSFTAGPFDDASTATSKPGGPGEGVYRVNGNTVPAELVSVWDNKGGEDQKGGWAAPATPERLHVLASWLAVPGLVPIETDKNWRHAMGIEIWDGAVGVKVEKCIAYLADRALATGKALPDTAKPPMTGAAVPPPTSAGVEQHATDTAPKVTVRDEQANISRDNKGPMVTDGETVDTARSTAANGSGVDSVFVCVGKTLNLGDYQSLRIDVGRTVAVRNGQTADQVESETLQAVIARVQQIEQEVVTVTRTR